MKEEIANLIALEVWIEKSLNNHAIKKDVYKELTGLHLLVNKKIVELILSKEFKEYIGYDKVAEVVKETADFTNIKTRYK